MMLRSIVLEQIAPHLLAASIPVVRTEPLDSEAFDLTISTAPDSGGGGSGADGASGAGGAAADAAALEPEVEAGGAVDAAADRGTREELRCVIVVARHADRNPKQVCCWLLWLLVAGCCGCWCCCGCGCGCCGHACCGWERPDPPQKPPWLVANWVALSW